MKKLIVGGCSFTYEDWCWPGQVYKELKDDLELVNVAMGSNGNDLIKKSIVAQVEKELETTKPEDIVVGVMWSGPDRWSFHSEDKLNANDWGKNGIVDNIYNPRSIVENYNKWYFINAFWDNEHSLLYYSTFHSNIGSIINTLECIIFLQLYLESKHIQYFMTTYLDIFNTSLFDIDVKNNPETGYLYQNINFKKFLPVEGCYEYLKKNYPEGVPTGKDNHPFPSGHKYFAKNVVIPFMLNNNLIENYLVQPKKLI